MSSKVYIGNLGRDPLPESDLEEEFEDFGPIKEIFVARNPPGFAYIGTEQSSSASFNVARFHVRKGREAGSARNEWQEKDLRAEVCEGRNLPQVEKQETEKEKHQPGDVQKVWISNAVSGAARRVQIPLQISDQSQTFATGSANLSLIFGRVQSFNP